MSQLSTLTEDKEQLIAANLNLYLFQNVWNETYRALRNNVIPQRLTKRTINGSIEVYGERIALPNQEEPFYVYATSNPTVAALSWPKQITYDWLDLSDLVNKYGVLFDVYHIHGKMLHKKFVYIHQLPNGGGYMVAISKKMVNKLIPHSEMDGIRFTTYYDHDMANKIDVYSYQVPVTDHSFQVRNQIWNKYKELQTVEVDQRQPTVLLSINGEESQIAGAGNIPLGSYVDLHIDRNTAIDIEFDLTVEGENAAFYSEIDACYKQLLHIPRQLNPDNLIMTHNAFEIYVRKKEPEADGTIRGLYLHRCAERSVTQVTHQDIAIPLYILDAYRDYFGTSEITLRVYWRQHEGVNTLIRDKNYIDILYQSAHADRVIIGILTGKYTPAKDLYFWKADYLEKSAFVNTMFDVPDVVTPANMTYYVDALGYYNVMYLLSKHIHRTVISNWYRGGYHYPKPLVYQGYPAAAIVYVNGEKVLDKHVTQLNNYDSHVVVDVAEQYQTIGNKLAVELHRDGVRAIYKIAPRIGSTEIVFPATEYDIIEEIDLDATYTVRKFGNVATKGYKPFTKLAGHVVKLTMADGKYKLIFGPSTYGRTFYIQPRPRVLYWSSEVAADGIDVQSKISRDEPLFFNLTQPVRFEAVDNVTDYSQKQERVLVWDTDTMMVYFNGRYCIRDVDFTIQDVQDNNNNTCMKILVLQNYSYMRDENNTLEVYSVSADNVNNEYGYCAPRIVDIDNPETSPVVIAGTIKDNRTVIYNQGATMVHVNGYYTEADVVGNFITKAESWSREWEGGNPIEVRTSVPYFVSDYLAKYHDNDDLERIELLNKYYFNKDLRRVDIEAFYQPHLIYSVYAAMVLHDVLYGNNTQLSYDPDIRRMLQQLEQYQYIANIDLVTQNKLNLDYVDIYPHYHQLHTPDIETYKLLHALLRACMPNDPVSNKKDIDLTHP